MNQEVKDDEQTKNGKKRKRIPARKVFRYNDLPHHLQHFLSQVRKTHMLCLTSHAIFASRYASNEDELHVAHSLIPPAWVMPTKSRNTNTANEKLTSVLAPTVQDLNHFVNWFLDFTSNNSMHTTIKRIRYNPTRTKAKKNQNQPKHKNNHGVKNSVQSSSSSFHYKNLEYCSHLARQQQIQQGRQNQNHHVQHDQDHNHYNEYDKTLLFLSMARSMGWRARFLVIIKPIPRDLNVDHPLFVSLSNQNIFLRIWNVENKNKKAAAEPIVLMDSDTENEDEEDSKPSPAKRAENSKNDQKKKAQQQPSLLHNDHNSSKVLCWVEVLCQSTGEQTTSSEKQPSMQWIHVDPVLGFVNRPSTIEQLFYAYHENIPANKALASNKRKAIPYALAVEHLERPTNTTNTTNSSSDRQILQRITDVTRRYASSMVYSLKARGIEQVKRRQGHKTINVGREDSDDWFKEFFNKLNHHTINKKKDKTVSTGKKSSMTLTPQKAAALKSKGKTSDDAIIMDDKEEKCPDKNNLAVVTPEASLTSNAVGNTHDYDTSIDHDEEKQLQASAKKEPIPTSKAAFKKHPLYVIPSVLNSTEIIVPDAKKRACGVFKGELVYLRKDVETALPAKRWLYLRRKVKESELPNPILKIQARKKPASKSFKALKSYGVGNSNDGSEEARAKQIQDGSQPLDDGKQHLYGSWQTEEWSPPPVGRDDPIPANEYDNIELELLNPGLVHVELDHVAKVAKQLSIPYKPCLLGFENNGGNSTPSIRGIVVHSHNEELLREAHQEMSSHFLQQEHENRQTAILRRWKRLLVGVLTKDRLDRTYGNET